MTNRADRVIMAPEAGLPSWPLPGFNNCPGELAPALLFR
jgi:hypothetical protein